MVKMLDDDSEAIKCQFCGKIIEDEILEVAKTC